MGFSQVPRQVRRAPTLALRAVFAGIGRVLLSAERPVASAAQAAAGDSERPRQLSARRQRPAATPVAPPGSRWRSLDKTGNVRLLSNEDVDDDYDMLPESGRSGARPGLAAARVADPPDEASRSAASAQTLPLANYDELSLASIRARLRGLDVGQLRVLAEYESKNAERPEVLGMFDRRISKLEAGE